MSSIHIPDDMVSQLLLELRAILTALGDSPPVALNWLYDTLLADCTDDSFAPSSPTLGAPSSPLSYNPSSPTVFSSPPSSPPLFASGLTQKRPRTSNDSISVSRNKRPRLLTGGYLPPDDSRHNGGLVQVINWDPDCRRNGERARARIAGMGASRQSGVTSGASFLFSSEENSQDNFLSFDDEDDLDMEGDELDDESYEPLDANDSDYTPTSTASRQPSSRRKTHIPRNQQQTWLTDGTPPPLSIKARRILVTLGTIVMPSNMEILGQLLQLLQTDVTTTGICTVYASMDPLAAVRNLGLRCLRLETDIHLTDFNFMLVLLQLVLATDIVRKKYRVGLSTIAAQSGISSDKFRDWIGQGTRLVYLVAAGTPQILLVIAALGLRAQVTRRQNTTNEDIFGVAFTLRSLCDDDIGKMIQQSLVPLLINLRQVSLPHMTFMFSPLLTQSEMEIWSADDMLGLDMKFNEVTVNYFMLPPRGDAWSLPISIPPAQSATQLADTVHIKFSKIFPLTSCPINKTNRHQWTDVQRQKAELAEQIYDLEDLELKLGNQEHLDRGQYIEIDSAICEGKTLILHDAEGKFIGLLITHMASFLPQCNERLLAQLNSLFPEELYHDSSDREGYNFLAIHYSWYNRFSEKGEGAPSDVHPYYIHKEGTAHVNHSQRVPRCSNDIQKDPQEHHLLSDFLQEVINFVNTNLEHHLPEEYQELTAYVERLPLNERSPAYPFGGFVINLCVSTHGHRDFGDKLLCVVIPFGDFTGGSLCLYEPGLVFKMAPADILIFPSCDITHFNLHFEGIRASLVLHSDKQGDGWVKNANGWAITRTSLA